MLTRRIFILSSIYRYSIDILEGFFLTLVTFTSYCHFTIAFIVIIADKLTDRVFLLRVFAIKRSILLTRKKEKKQRLYMITALFKVLLTIT